MRRKTLRGQILLAFLTMSVITAALGYFSVRGLEREGTLVDRTYDRSLMSINFSRAAAADFKDLQAVATRRAFSTDVAARAGFDKRIVELEAEMDDDLSVAVERAQSDAAVAVGRKVQGAVADWKVAMQRILSDTGNTAAWASLDHAASVVAQELDLLVNYTAGDGFTYRQSAHATIQADRHFNIAATLLAVLASGAIAWLLSRRLVQPIEKASEIAGRIADGDLEVRIPQGNADELGALLAAMETMRGNIKASMEREVELRRSAQTRLAAALESSCEGIVVVGADDRIALANAQASRLLGHTSTPLTAGDPATRVERALASVGGAEAEDFARAHDVELPDGRWLRMSRSRTQEGGSIFVYSDVSLVKAQQAALKTTNLWLDAALANLSQGLCLFDAANRLKVYNQRFCELFGLSPSRIRQGMTLDELIEIGFQADRLVQPIGEFRTDLMGRIADGRPTERLYQLRQGRTVAVSHRPLDERSWLATYEDVTDRLQAAEKISYMARHDALTGLPNRAFFVERIEAALSALDTGGRFALLCLDLDRFKEVNDTLGHPIGDKLLTAVAGRLRGAIRGGDMVVRLGGDEFAIIQTIESDTDAAALADRIITALGTPFEIEGNPLTIGVSIGISLAPLDGHSYDELLKNADLALYRAKDEGRNGWHFFERAMDERQRARRLIELDLRQALDHDQFELEYHPLVEVESDRISGFEALLRWRHPTRGSVAPAVFIPIAEEIGLIATIGDLVLHRACRDAVRWPGVSVAVNVSGTQLRNGRLLDVVLAALDSSGLPAHRLILEITESVLIANAQSARTILDKCKALGIRIAMDDFGTGYSSLSYLRSFPFDDVKIDKSFISEVTTQPESAAIVHAIVALCGSLGMRTTAEGVETPEQLAFLRQEGCHAAQGFLFSRPVVAEAVPRLLEARSASATGRSAMKAA